MTSAPFTPSATTPFRSSFLALLEAGAALLARLLAHAATPAQPTRQNPTPQQRVAYALEWAAALARTLAGDRFFLPQARYPRFPGRYPALTAALRAEIGLPPIPPPTPAARATARTRYMRKIFATRPTGRIAARIATRLGLTPDSQA